MATSILPQTRPPRRRTPAQPVRIFEGTSGHEQAIAMFIERVELYARQDARRCGKRYSARAFTELLQVAAANLIAADLPF